MVLLKDIGNGVMDVGSIVNILDDLLTRGIVEDIKLLRLYGGGRVDLLRPNSPFPRRNVGGRLSGIKRPRTMIESLQTVVDVAGPIGQEFDGGNMRGENVPPTEVGPEQTHESSLPAPPMASNGAQMLAWKNSLTRMYHTYQIYNFSAVKDTVNAAGTDYVHQTGKGTGPALYWIISKTLKDSATGGTGHRNPFFNTPLTWDGGMNALPKQGPPIRDYGLGTQGTIYVFAADWPGTIMNPDTNTQTPGTVTNSEYKWLEWLDYGFAGNTTSKNYPRVWKDVFANTNWQYITIYSHHYRFDVTNVTPQDYCIEIQLFKFKADVDAMDYEKQCLAAFGGIHGGTAPYMLNLPYFPVADVTILKTKRYMVKACQSATLQQMSKPHFRSISWKIKNKVVLKRPVLTSYETTLTETDIFTKYYDPQKGHFFRCMAWPMNDLFSCNIDTAPVVQNQSNSIPTAVSNSTECMNGLDVKIYKKSYFKLDETATNY